MPSLIVRWFFPAHCGECLISAYSARQRNCKSRSPLTDSEETSTRKKRQLTRADPAFGCVPYRVTKSFGKSLNTSQRMLTHVRRLCLREANGDIQATPGLPSCAGTCRTGLWTRKVMLQLQIKLTIFFSLFVGTVSAQVLPNAHASQFILVAKPASDSVAVTMTIPSDVKLKTLSAHLNGKDISARLTSASCPQTNCQQATLTVSDGLHGIKNVLSVMAKRNDGSLVSARTRFAGAAATLSARVANTSRQPVHANVSALPTLSDFLPPAISFTTLKFGGYASGSPWFRIGSQTTYPASPGTYSCSGIYTVIVLDRQTLQEKTAAPENSPNCVSNGASLKTYLATLNGGDLVIVGSNSNHNSDAGTGFGVLDTSTIGGSVYNCVNSSVCTALPPDTVALPDVPLGYMAIGVGGAASGSAYEYYVIGNGQISPTWTTTLSHATGMLVEDPDGNYAFQTSQAIEYTVLPNDAAQSGLSSVTVGTIPGDPYSKQGAVSKLYTTPVAPGSNGMWMLQLQRSTLFSTPFNVPPPAPAIINGDACPLTSLQNGVANFSGCGQFYATGASDPTTAAAAYASLQSDLAKVIGHAVPESVTDLIFLVSIGNVPGFPGFNFSLVPSPFATSFSAIGGTPETFTALSTLGSTYSYVGCTQCDNSLGGHVIISTSLQAQQGQNGYIHGLLQPNLNGLYWPTQASLDQPGSDGSPTTDFTIQEVTSTQPVEWPELSSTQTLTSGAFTADSTAGQNAAYYYISYQLINNYYIIGAQGDFIDDIHYYFTGGNNTFLDYHTFDPATLPFPGSLPTDCFQWTDPVPTRGTLSCFTQNDFNAVRAQMHNEIVYLTNVLQFMVNGSTNMKDVVASGNGSAALALINAAAQVQASTLQPPPATPVKSKVSAILNLTANVVSTGVALATAGLGVPEASDAINLALKLLGPASGVTRGTFGMASAITSGLTTGGRTPLPSRDYPFLTTIGNLSNNSLQQGFTAGFDSGLDTILADWGKLSTIGPMITDTNNPAFQSPTQSSQLLGITQIGQGAQRTFYMALLPIDYSVQHYTYWYGQPGVTNFPDMGARIGDSTSFCNTWYYTAPAPSTINLVSKSYLSYSDEGPTQFAFWDVNSTEVPIPMPLDWFIVASSAAPKNAGTATQQIQLLDAQVTSTLFSADQLNIPMDPFLDQGGPMAGAWADSAKVGFDHFPANQTCSLFVAGKFGTALSPSGSVGGAKSNPVTVTPNIPASGVLGDNVVLQATAVAAGAPVTSGVISFADGGNEIGRPSLDATGTATLSVATFALGTHTISASFVATQQLTASSPVSASLTIYANDPDLAIALSASNLSVASGATSSPLALQVSSKWGLAGTVAFSCSGLPAGATCRFSPSQVTLTGGSSASTSLTISDQRQTARLWPSLPVFAVILLPLPLLRRKHLATTMKPVCTIMAAGLLLSLFLAACGGSSNPPPPAMQPVTSTVLVTATAGKISRSVPLDLTLQ